MRCRARAATSRPGSATARPSGSPRRRKNSAQGHVEGIVESGAANNASVSGDWIPALVFGIPGDSITAIVIGVLYLKNLNPGPMIFQQQAELVTAIFIVFFLANIIMVPFGWLAIKASVPMLRVPRTILMPVILMFCIVGAFSITNSAFAVSVMLAFGVLGFLMEENGFPVAPGDPRDRARPDAGEQLLQLDDQGGRQFHRVLRASDRRLPRPRDDRHMGRDDLVLLAPGTTPRRGKRSRGKLMPRSDAKMIRSVGVGVAGLAVACRISNGRRIRFHHRICVKPQIRWRRAPVGGCRLHLRKQTSPNGTRKPAEGQKETFVRVLAIADILAIIRHRERGRHSLLSPDRAARASWGNGECAVPVFEITRYRCLSLDYSGVVAVVDDCASHPTEHRLNDIQKLRLRGQG